MAAVALIGFAVVMGAPTARGGPRDPGAFSSLGTLNISSGSYTFSSTTDQLLDSSNNVLFTGVTSNGIAVFDFSQITISGGSFRGTGSNPLALLYLGNIGITGGSINVSAGGPASGAGGPRGYGGATIGSTDPGGGPGGGGFVGGGGGAAGSFMNSRGKPYGDLKVQLVGGSGGCASNSGGGGGAPELGASGSLAINGGTIAATGGDGYSLGGEAGGGGGGSGGGVFLHADSVSLAGSTVLDVDGGAFAGGRILILAKPYTNLGARFDLAGGAGAAGNYGRFPSGSPGDSSVLTIVPEPPGLVLLTTMRSIVAYAQRRRATESPLPRVRVSPGEIRVPQRE
jgi:hypothetical protein